MTPGFIKKGTFLMTSTTFPRILEPTYYTARMKSLIKRTRRYAVNMINQHGDKELIGNRKIYFDDLFIGEKEEMDDIVEKLKRGEEL